MKFILRLSEVVTSRGTDMQGHVSLSTRVTRSDGRPHMATLETSPVVDEVSATSREMPELPAELQRKIFAQAWHAQRNVAARCIQHAVRSYIPPRLVYIEDVDQIWSPIVVVADGAYHSISYSFADLEVVD